MHPYLASYPSVIPCLATAVLAASCLSSSALVILDLEINRLATAAGEDWFFAYPTVSTDLPVDYSVEIHSGSGNFASTLTGASSTVFASFSDLISALDVNPWTVTIIDPLAVETVYSFEMDASGVQPSDLPATSITTPAFGAVLPAPADITLEWTGPSSYGSLSASVEFRPSGPLVELAALDPAETTWSPSVALGEGQYRARVSYRLSEAPGLSTTIPSRDDGSGGTEFLPWFSTASLVSGAERDFEVVPEPSAYAALSGLGLIGWAAWRRLARASGSRG